MATLSVGAVLMFCAVTVGRMACMSNMPETVMRSPACMRDRSPWVPSVCSIRVSAEVRITHKKVLDCHDMSAVIVVPSTADTVAFLIYTNPLFAMCISRTGGMSVYAVAPAVPLALAEPLSRRSVNKDTSRLDGCISISESASVPISKSVTETTNMLMDMLDSIYAKERMCGWSDSGIYA